MTIPASTVSANPFLALRPFTRADAGSFFGRDTDLVLIQSRLFSSRCTLLFAASGVGKSSFLDAKLGPAVESHWQIVTHRSWATEPPLAALRASIAATSAAAGEGSDLVKQVERLVTADAESRGCLVVLDQFEEVFQHWRDSKALDTFASEVSRLVHEPGLEARVLVSMREEFLGELSLFDNLIPDMFNSCYRLKNATQAEAEEIITRTAQLRGAECGDGLEPLLDDLVTASSRFGTARGIDRVATGEESPHSRIPMPFLQIVCYRLWQQQMMPPHSHARFLERAPGPVRGELEAYCREKLQALSPAEQDLAAAAFGFLMTRSGAKMAYPIDVLAEQAHVDEKALLAVLMRLAAEDVRLLRPIATGLNAKPWFELYHDLYSRFLTDWKREHDASRSTQQGRRSLVTMVALLILSGMAVGLGTWWNTTSNEKIRLFADQLLGTANEQRTPDGQETPLSLRLKIESMVRGWDPAREALRQALGRTLVETKQFPLPTVDRIAVSPNGQVLCTVEPSRISLRRLPDGKSIGVIDRMAFVSAVAFSPDSTKLAAAGWDGKIEIVSTADAHSIAVIDVIAGGLLNGVTFSADGAMLAVNGDSSDDREHLARVYPMAAPNQELLTVSHKTPVTVVAFSPDTQYVLTGSEDGYVHLTNLVNKVETTFYHETKIVAAAFTADSGKFATASTDGVVVTTPISGGGSTQLFEPTANSVNVLAFNPRAGRYLATGQGVVWDLDSLKAQPQPLGTESSLTTIAFTPDGQLVAGSGGTGAFILTTALHDSRSVHVLARLNPGQPVRSMTLGPKGDWLAIAVDGTLRLFSVRPAGSTLPANDRDLEKLACTVAGPIDPSRVRTYLGSEPLRGCQN